MVSLPVGMPDEMRREIDRIKNNLSGHPLVSKVVLFGSVAAGTNGADSDVDIAVFLKKDAPCGVKEFKELNRLVGRFDYDIQLQVFSEDELDDPCGIVEEIVSFGILLHDAAEDEVSHMEGLFINKAGTALSASAGESKLSLLARRPGMEVMLQTVLPNAVVWVTPAEDNNTIEFFYVLSGSMVLLPDTEAIEMGPGDSFYAEGLSDDVLIKVKEPTKLLYLTNQPLFEDVLSFQGDLESLMRRVDDKDKYTYQHSRNVMEYSLQLYRKLCPNEPLNDITTAALFHDVGKCLLPDEILKKPGKLTDLEYQQIRKHPINSARLLQSRFGSKISEIARSHHERMDGSGYPYGLAGDEILLEGRIIAVADSFDAMTSKRVYKNGTKSIEESINELCSMTRSYDPVVTNALRELWESGELYTPEGEK